MKIIMNSCVRMAPYPNCNVYFFWDFSVYSCRFSSVCFISFKIKTFRDKMQRFKMITRFLFNHFSFMCSSLWPACVLCVYRWTLNAKRIKQRCDLNGFGVFLVFVFGFVFTWCLCTVYLWCGALWIMGIIIISVVYSYCTLSH